MRTLRTPLGKVRGLGSAKEGVEHWWMQRLSSIALIPLSIWFIIGVLGHIGADYADMQAWLSSPFAAIMMILFVGVTMWHTAQGAQVIIEDYVHNEWAKVSSLIAVKFASFGLAVAGIYAVLKIAFGG